MGWGRLGVDFQMLPEKFARRVNLTRFTKTSEDVKQKIGRDSGGELSPMARETRAATFWTARIAPPIAHKRRMVMYLDTLVTAIL